jgi:CTP:molybdopterin cytidylyltransferase MocA
MPSASRAAHPFASGIVLAAGASTRMGRPKALVPLAGAPLLQHVVDAAAHSRLAELVLVLGPHADEIRAALAPPSRLPLRVALVSGEAPGASASLAAGLRAADPRADVAVVLLGDQPGVAAALIDRLVAEFAAGSAPALRPVWRDAQGRAVPGHPVLLARSLWGAALELRGDAGARQLFGAHPEWLRELQLPGEPPADLDTPEDLARAEAVARRSSEG